MISERSRSRLYYATLFAILALATWLRVHDLENLPPGFFCDEAGNGYNAYSILKTGRDESGTLLPLYVWSFGVSYKNPVFVYTAAGPIAVTGLSEASVRFTSALFGVLAVLAIAIVGGQIGGPITGLASALILALCPWHLQFSRIAFELIAFPTFMLFAFAALIAGVRGRPRLLVLAGALFSLCLYTYGPAKLFVPLFLVGAAVFYARRLLGALRPTLIAVVVALAVAAPVIAFDVAHRDRSQQYIHNTTSWRSEQPFAQNTSRLLQNYQKFFDVKFLFEQGDPIPRHSVQGFGELDWAIAPLLVFGALWALWLKNPEGKLILWWLLLYPLAPSLMNEIPSASRGIIGSAGFCLLAGCGAGAVFKVVSRLLRRPWLVIPVQALAALAFLFAIGQQAIHYWQVYTTKYPAYAAEAFQYGYREAIDFMEKRRGDFDLLMLTANNVNQPQIFAAFYRPVDPNVWQKSENSGYLIIDPSEYDRYKMNQRILGAFRLDDLRLFDDYTELHRVLRPGGEVEYVIAEPHVRRRFLRRWLISGPFTGNAASAEANAADVSPHELAGALGPAYWRRVKPQFVDVNLNDFFSHSAEKAGKPLMGLCALAATQIEVPTETKANFEVSGAGTMRGWENGQAFASTATRLSRSPRRYPVTLRAGRNEFVLEICKAEGDWRFAARLTGEGERDLPGFKVHAQFAKRPPALAKPEEPQQTIDGFGEVTIFDHQSDRYADYRGDSPGWWEHLGDPNGALEWKTAVVPAKKPTEVIFTAAVGDARGKADLYVNGHYALSFSTGRFDKPQRWQRGGFVLEYQPQESGHGVSGPWRLIVPADFVTPGQPLTLRVAHRFGARDAFFMIKGRNDTTFAAK